MNEQRSVGPAADAAWARRARALAQIIAVLRPDVGLHAAVETVLQQLTAIAGTVRGVFVIQDHVSNAIVRWDFQHHPQAGRPATFTVTELTVEEWHTFFFSTPSDFWLVGFDAPHALVATELPAPFRATVPFVSLAGIDFHARSDRGRLFLPDPGPDETTRGNLTWLHGVLPPIALALSGLARLRRMRRRAEHHERARLGRELHDGPIQEFIAIRLQIEWLRRHLDDPALAAQGVDLLDRSLDDAIERLRSLSDRARAGVVAPAALVPLLQQLVGRFADDTGIAADFRSSVESVRVSPRTAYELAAILREALLNVARHSRATVVRVQLSEAGDVCRLLVDDNGRGLDPLAPVAVPSVPLGALTPGVIAERVSAVGGMLTVGSSPSGGARIEVSVPGASSD